MRRLAQVAAAVLVAAIFLTGCTRKVAAAFKERMGRDWVRSYADLGALRAPGRAGDLSGGEAAT